MKLEKLDDSLIPGDLSEHWSGLQRVAGPGKLHTEVGMREPHQIDRLNAVVDLAFAHRWREKSSCLEIGCCEGAMTAKLARGFTHITAVDFVQSLLDACPPLPNVTYELHDIEVWEPLGQWDVAVMGEVLEHLKDPVGALRRVAQHSRRIVASCPVNEDLNHDAWDLEKIDALLNGSEVGIGDGSGHVWAMDMEGFESLFYEADLTLLYRHIIFPSGILVAEGLLT